MYADQKYGGLGLDDFRYDMILCEELGPREPGFFTLGSQSDHGAIPSAYRIRCTA